MDTPRKKLKTAQETYDAIDALAMGGGGDGVLVIYRDALRHLHEKLLRKTYIIPKTYLVVLINKGLIEEKSCGGCLKSETKKYVVCKYVTSDMIDTSLSNNDPLPDSNSSSSSSSTQP